MYVVSDDATEGPGSATKASMLAIGSMVVAENLFSNATVPHPNGVEQLGV